MQQSDMKGKFFEFVRSVLKPETVNHIMRHHLVNPRGWKILDRWAFHHPELLKKVEDYGVKNRKVPNYTPLVSMIVGQQLKEQDVLLTPSVNQQINEGLSEIEALEMHGVSTKLTFQMTGLPR